MVAENCKMTGSRQRKRNRNAGLDEDETVRTEECMKFINWRYRENAVLIQCHECDWGAKGQKMRNLFLRQLMREVLWEVLNRLEISD